ncbi:MAG: DUF3307 domain-containing protein [Candidatus Brocadia sp. WS118]|nr:MAG: DUF3307 domain-containing protein [Candidatus Brocadia sp. WS118]
MYGLLSQNDVLLLLRLIVAHVAADFLFPWNSLAGQQFGKKWRSGWLYAHGACAGALAYAFAGLWNVIWLPFVICISHILRDALTSQGEDKARFLLLDHLGHGVILLGCWIILIHGTLSDIVTFLFSSTANIPFWTVILSYIVVIWPAGALIGTITKPWRNEITKEPSSQGLEKAGLWIGRLERVLILTFILLKHFEAIGFLIAAKSILRFGETRAPNSRKEAEYILIGTMISFVIAILLGIFTSWMLQYPLVMEHSNQDNAGSLDLFEI